MQRMTNRMAILAAGVLAGALTGPAMSQTPNLIFSELRFNDYAEDILPVVEITNIGASPAFLVDVRLQWYRGSDVEPDYEATIIGANELEPLGEFTFDDVQLDPGESFVLGQEPVTIGDTYEPELEDILQKKMDRNSPMRFDPDDGVALATGPLENPTFLDFFGHRGTSGVPDAYGFDITDGGRYIREPWVETGDTNPDDPFVALEWKPVSDPNDFSTLGNHTYGVSGGPDVIVGDVNVDLVLDESDIAPFIELLLDEQAYRQSSGISSALLQPLADINGDGTISGLDIQPFVNELLASGNVTPQQMAPLGAFGVAIPEPTTAALLGVGAMILIRRRRRAASRTND